MGARSIPVAIACCNPGSLAWTGVRSRISADEDGLTHYRSMLDGAGDLLVELHNAYKNQHHRTLSDIVCRMHAATADDTSMMERDIGTRLQIEQRLWPTRDLRLNLAWPMLDFVRAYVFALHGPSSPDWIEQPEWIAPSMWLRAMEHTGCWRFL